MITAWALQAGQKLRDSRLSRRAILCWYGVPQGKGEQWALKFETKAPPALSLPPVAEVIHIAPRLNRAQRRAGVRWSLHCFTKPNDGQPE